MADAKQLKRGQIGPIDPKELHDSDPRGILWVWEAPRKDARYVVGADAAKGIAGWDRALRTEQDLKIDNCAAQVIKIGEFGAPDEQVAEFAAPIDAEEFATVLNTLGRWYAGREESGQALIIPEVWPGPGLATVGPLLNQFKYQNIFVWVDLKQNATAQPVRKLGWYSDQVSRPQLWIRGTRHITRRRVIIHSPWLVEEMSDCEEDLVKMVAKAASGMHDDRVIAFLLGLWAANDWSYYTMDQELADENRDKQQERKPDWFETDISYDQMKEAINDRIAELFDMAK